jgi:NADPH:quinone reductase-like Zn-dependent oxidoreductase
MAIEEKHVSLKPSNLSHVEAATLPLVGLTIWQALVDFAHVIPGQQVVILGASGGTGTFAIQLAKKHLAAKVIAICSERNAELCTSLGADEIVDYTKANWSDTLTGRNIDVFLDCLGGEQNYDNALKVCFLLFFTKDFFRHFHFICLKVSIPLIY